MNGKLGATSTDCAIMPPCVSPHRVSNPEKKHPTTRTHHRETEQVDLFPADVLRGEGGRAQSLKTRTANREKGMTLTLTSLATSAAISLTLYVSASCAWGILDEPIPRLSKIRTGAAGEPSGVSHRCSFCGRMERTRPCLCEFAGEWHPIDQSDCAQPGARTSQSAETRHPLLSANAPMHQDERSRRLGPTKHLVRKVIAIRSFVDRVGGA